MSEHDKANRSGVSEKAQGRRVGTSVLVAAASMLGTSLGVSAATPAEFGLLSAQESVGHNAVETTPVEGNNLLLAKEINLNTPTPHISVKPSTPPVSAKPSYFDKSTPKFFKSIGAGTHIKSGTMQ